MATWNAAAVSDAVIAFRKGITLNQIRQLRDNMLAIAEGATGAPKVELDALEIAVDTSTNTLVGGGSVFIAKPSARSLFPNLTLAPAMSAVFVNGGVQITNSGASAIYTVEWPYLRNTP